MLLLYAAFQMTGNSRKKTKLRIQNSVYKVLQLKPKGLLQTIRDVKRKSNVSKNVETAELLSQS